MVGQNQITDLLDHELNELSLGRRASDKIKRKELESLVVELAKVSRLAKPSSSSRPSPGRTAGKASGFSSADIGRATDLFFELLSSEENSSPPLRLLLGFLQRPVELSAQKGPSFFLDANHPARRVIKALFVREKDIVNKSEFQVDAVYLSLHKAVKDVVREYQGDDRLFLKAYYDILGA